MQNRMLSQRLWVSVMAIFATVTVTITITTAPIPAFAQNSLTNQAGDQTVKEIERYRQALDDGNPAELWEARGEDLWKQKRGPKNVSLEQCDLGLGVGVVKGAYTVLPKHFSDTGKVEDLESRLVTCMVMLQGFSYADAKKNPFGGPGNKADMEALVAYTTGASRGLKMNVSGKHVDEKRFYELGKKMFFHRGADVLPEWRILVADNDEVDGLQR